MVDLQRADDHTYIMPDPRDQRDHRQAAAESDIPLWMALFVPFATILLTGLLARLVDRAVGDSADAPAASDPTPPVRTPLHP